MTQTQIPLAGVIGDPISHSLSPKLHGHWLKSNKINGHYIPMPVAQEHLETVLRSLAKAGFRGVNVTLPHKESVLKIADALTERASAMGAANTLTFQEDGSIHGDNTDGYGFIENLKQSAPMWKPKNGPSAVFGAGGASRAIIIELLAQGVPEVRLSNRTIERARALKNEFGARIKVYEWETANDMLQDAETVVNTTALGMVNKAAFSVPLVGIKPGAVVSDIVYTPLRTEFLKDAEKQGAIVVDGLGMLLHQAVPGFERWFGIRPIVDDALRTAVLGQ